MNKYFINFLGYGAWPQAGFMMSIYAPLHRSAANNDNDDELTSASFCVGPIAANIPAFARCADNFPVLSPIGTGMAA